MIKMTIKAADEATFHRMLLAFVELSLERFDTDALLDEARHRLGKKGYAVDVVPNTNKPPESEPETQLQPQPQPQPAKRRPGRPPKNPEVQPVQPAPQDGRPAPQPAPHPAPSRDEVITALEGYAVQNENGMVAARRIMAEVSGVKNAALKDVDPADYRKLIEALA